MVIYFSTLSLFNLIYLTQRLSNISEPSKAYIFWKFSKKVNCYINKSSFYINFYAAGDFLKFGKKEKRAEPNWKSTLVVQMG